MTYPGFVRALVLIAFLSGALCLPLACAHDKPKNQPQCGLVRPDLLCCAVAVGMFLVSHCEPVTQEPAEPKLDDGSKT